MAEPFRIFETSAFRADLDDIRPPGLRERLSERLRTHVFPQLARHPFVGPGIRKLQGLTPATWRYRLGEWRIFFRVDDDARIVHLLTIENRKDAY